MKSRIFILLLIAGCTTPPTPHVQQTYPTGEKRVEYLYVGDDYLNREERTYHNNGKLLSSGIIEGGKRIGVWKSYYPDSTIWSEHFYIDGEMHGDYRVNHPNGKPRIVGKFDNGKEIGTWYFLGEAGDTLTVREMN